MHIVATVTSHPPRTEPLLELLPVARESGIAEAISEDTDLFPLSANIT
jgi:hypothetical protein